ncbi:Sapep family Mn(2+)-dependent dipeptidase [symbiont of Argiope bruennichi]|uniref:Sapep family Mn(2+)-dependent dipeptidase n=1 Tax=symbiont of Argiope bruennichi TaxID=2810479 RepID=UPI003DA593E8
MGLKTKFFQEIKNEKDNILRDLKSIINIDTTLDKDSVDLKNHMPYGKNVRKGFNFIKKLAEDNGFYYYEYEGKAAIISYLPLQDKKDYQDTIMMATHIDTVPFHNDNWKFDPLSGEIENGFLYGRGAIDDKGPLIASFYTLKILKKLGIKSKYNFTLFIGGNEENGSDCAKSFFKAHKPPLIAFTPDCVFPLVAVEKSITHVLITLSNVKTYIKDIKVYGAMNVVPGKCYVDIDVAKWQVDEWIDIFKEKNYFIKIRYELLDNGLIRIYSIGKTAHGSAPQEGKNALTYLMSFLQSMKSDPLAHFIAGYFHEDHYGKSLEINYYDKLEEELTISLNLCYFEKNNITLGLDIRHPSVQKKENILSNLLFILEKHFKNKPKLKFNHVPGYKIDDDNKFKQIFLNNYQKISGDYTSKPIVTGGGTYARSIPNCVAFGLLFPTEEGTEHKPNERININNLLLSIEIFCNVVEECGNLN